ncbi:unnamed protein product, partial [Closterium sp. NIES-65]
LVVWVAMNMLADTFAAMDIFPSEVQLLLLSTPLPFCPLIPLAPSSPLHPHPPLQPRTSLSLHQLFLNPPPLLPLPLNPSCSFSQPLSPSALPFPSLSHLPLPLPPLSSPSSPPGVPLLFIIILIVWVTMNMLADTFAAMDIFLIEVQLLAMVANFNLNFPASWVKTVVLLYNIAAFDPVSFPAVVTVSGSQRWVKSRLS